MPRRINLTLPGFGGGGGGGQQKTPAQRERERVERLSPDQGAAIRTRGARRQATLPGGRAAPRTFEGSTVLKQRLGE